MVRVAKGSDPSAPPSRVLQGLALLYLVSTPLDVVELPVATPATLTGGLFLFAWLLSLFGGGVALPRAPRLLGTMAAMVAWSFCTVMWSYAPSASVNQSITTTLLAVSAVAISGVFRGSLVLPAAALALGATASGIAAMVSGPEWVQDGAFTVRLEQVTFLGVDQNILAFHLSLGLAAAAFLILDGRRSRLRLQGLGMAIVLCASLIMVGSRTGVGALLGIGILMVVFSATSLKRAGVALLAVSGSAGILLLISTAGLVPTRVAEWIQNPVAMDGRSQIIDAYTATWSEWIWRGVGAGGDAYYLQIATSWWFKNAHSAFWKVWIELGIVGLILWAVFLAGVALRAYRSRERAFFGFCAIPIVLFFYTLAPINSNMLWVVFGLALGVTLGRTKEPQLAGDASDDRGNVDPGEAGRATALTASGRRRRRTANDVRLTRDSSVR